MSEIWTIGRILQWTQNYFSERGIDNPRLDAEVLLADSLGVNRVYLYTHYDQPLSDAERTPFRQRVMRRARREPVAYILGRREFFGRDFVVSDAVLIPRPETEHLVEAVLVWLKEQALDAPRICDIGTGSGAIALTLAAEVPNAQVVATDISKKALQVARQNAQALGVDDRVQFLQGDMWAPVQGVELFDCVVSNPPYIDIADKATLQPEVVSFEPQSALFASDRGRAEMMRLFEGAAAHLRSPGLFACEVGAGQASDLLEHIARDGRFERERAIADLAGHQRVVIGERRL